MPTTEQKTAALNAALTDPTFPHADDMLTAMRAHARLDHDTLVDHLHEHFVSTNTPKKERHP